MFSYKIAALSLAGLMLATTTVSAQTLGAKAEKKSDKTSGKTDKPRVIHLNDAALAILTRLTGLHPSGPLFRNSKGRAWNRHSINCAVRRIRSLTGLDGRSVVYALRHHWATDARV